MNFNELEILDTKIEVIRKEDLNPGDLVLIKCARGDEKVVANWADEFFKAYKVRVGTVWSDMEFKVFGASTELPSKSSL